MVDSLGPRMKFGVIAPSTNTIVQPEYDEMRPTGVTNHMGRIHIPDMPLHNDEDFKELVAAIETAQDAAIERVMTCHPGHLILGISAETFWEGADASERLLTRLREFAGVGVTMASHACRAAFDAIGGIKRIGVVTPYMPVADRNVERYFTEVGYEVRRLRGLCCASPALISHVSSTQLREAVTGIDGDDVDAIIQVGTNLAMGRLSGELERELGKPVVAINVATYWHALRTCGIQDRMQGFGQLLASF